MHDLRGLAWILPATTLIFIAYVVFAFVGALHFGLPVWLIALTSLPPLGLTSLALIVAVLDVTRRPKGDISEEMRIIWVLVLIIVPVVGLLPYWLTVMRRRGAAVS